MWCYLVSKANFLLQKVVEAFTIILAAFELLYLLSLHVGIFGGDYGPAYTTTPGVSAATTGHVGLQGEKHHSAAAAAAAVWLKHCKKFDVVSSPKNRKKFEGSNDVTE